MSVIIYKHIIFSHLDNIKSTIGLIINCDSLIINFITFFWHIMRTN